VTCAHHAVGDDLVLVAKWHDRHRRACATGSLVGTGRATDSPRAVVCGAVCERIQFSEGPWQASQATPSRSLEALAALARPAVVGVAIEAQLRFVRRLPQAEVSCEMRCERSRTAPGRRGSRACRRRPGTYSVLQDVRPLPRRDRAVAQAVRAVHHARCLPGGGVGQRCVRRRRVESRKEKPGR